MRILTLGERLEEINEEYKSKNILYQNTFYHFLSVLSMANP